MVDISMKIRLRSPASDTPFAPNRTLSTDAASCTQAKMRSHVAARSCGVAAILQPSELKEDALDESRFQITGASAGLAQPPDHRRSHAAKTDESNLLSHDYLPLRKLIFAWSAFSVPCAIGCAGNLPSAAGPRSSRRISAPRPWDVAAGHDARGAARRSQAIRRSSDPSRQTAR